MIAFRCINYLLSSITKQFSHRGLAEVLLLKYVSCLREWKCELIGYDLFERFSVGS